MVAKSIIAGNPRELIAKIEEWVEEGLRPNLAVIFLSPEHDFQPLQAFCRSRQIALMGATSAGEICDAHMDEQSVSCLLLQLPENTFEVYINEDITNEPVEHARRAARAAAEHFQSISLLAVSSGLSTDGDSIIAGIQQELGTAVELAGGMAGDDLKMEKTMVFSADAQSDRGLCLLIFDASRLQMRSLAASGWQAVGIAKTITHSRGNHVFTLDGEPMLDVYKKYFGMDEVNLARRVVEVGIHYPLQVLREDGPPLLRAPLIGNRDDRSVVFAGSLPEGSKVKMSIPAGAQITESLLDAYQELHDEIPSADAILLFSCVGRSNALGPLMEEEIARIHDVWKVPTVGFFTYGEIGRALGDVCNFHNETCVLVLMRELAP